MLHIITHTFQTPLESRFETIRTNGVEIYQVDGLDGSGKGELANALAAILPGNALIIDYPAYNTPYGKLITNLLRANDPNITLKDRLLLFAVNRLETIDTILLKAKEVYESEPGIPLNIIFDRCPTSCVITLAYYYNSLPSDQKPSNINEWVTHHFDMGMEMDAYFIRIFGLDSAPAYVPAIDPNLALSAIAADKTRIGTDLYENTTVQGIANDFYLNLAVSIPSRIKLFPQMIGDIRLTPAQQAETILNLRNSTVTTQVGGSITKMHFTNASNIDRINELIAEHGSEYLQSINPYKHYGLSLN